MYRYLTILDTAPEVRNAFALSPNTPHLKWLSKNCSAERNVKNYAIRLNIETSKLPIQLIQLRLSC